MLDYFIQPNLKTKKFNNSKIIHEGSYFTSFQLSQLYQAKPQKVQNLALTFDLEFFLFEDTVFYFYADKLNGKLNEYFKQRKPLDYRSSNLSSTRKSLVLQYLVAEFCRESGKEYNDFLNIVRSMEPIQKALGSNLRSGQIRGYLEAIISNKLEGKEDAPIINFDRNEDLIKRVMAGDESARIDLMQANLGLVRMQAYKLQGKLTVDELYAAGLHGLYKATQQFEFGRGAKFSSYAIKCIWATMFREIQESKTIHIPVHVQEALWKLRNENIDKISDEDLREKYKTSRGCLKNALQTISPKSLHTKFKEGETGELMDVIPSQASVESQVFYSALQEDILHVFSNCLTDKETQVMAYRYFDEMTLEEIGRTIGVTRERVRQIQKKSIGKLRRSRRARKKLEDYLD